MRRVLLLCALTLCAVALAVAPVSVPAQTQPDPLRRHTDSLAKIRAEREQLEAQMRTMQGRVRDLTEEVNNISRQSATTARMVEALNSQLVAINNEVSSSTANLVRAQDELKIKEADLRRRVIDIYRRGPLHTLEVLFSAQSFTDLIARYKYLHLQTIRDQAMVRRVRELKTSIEDSRSTRVKLQAEVVYNREETAREQQRMKVLEQQRRSALTNAQTTATATQTAINRINEDERRLNALITALSNEARSGTAPEPVAGGPAFRVGAMLDWPVDGELVYRFGRVTTANNTQIRQNGIGISAPRGTTVRAVALGRVYFAENYLSYGNMVAIEHGSGDFSVYASLERIDVQVGQSVTRGQPIGTVGVSDTTLGPHIHFEVRLNKPPQPLLAVDPLPFMRPPR